MHAITDSYLILLEGSADDQGLLMITTEYYNGRTKPQLP